MKNYLEVTWKGSYSTHRTLLVGATVAVWCSRLIFHHESKVSLLKGVLALLNMLFKTLGIGKLI